METNVNITSPLQGHISFAVMAGLVPAIHVFLRFGLFPIGKPRSVAATNYNPLCSLGHS